MSVLITSSVFVTSIGFGLVAAAVLALAAVGFTLQFAVTNVLNLAYGGVMIVSAYAAYVLNHAGVEIWIAVIASIVAGALMSLFLNTVVYTPFQRRGTSSIAMVIVSLGMTLIFVFGTQAIAGPTNVSYAMSQGATVKVGSIELTVVQLVLIALSIVVMCLVHGLIRYTRLGKAMRATAANRNLARNCGIR
ncbi:MAG TPA: branched-chain amino acid ABC transporter permease, partial [Solirubrobacteraceae bacterium]|nr:branched-chain amino acid ABC transporter permease [Solirubrobacteraceae bacterium]